MQRPVVIAAELVSGGYGAASADRLRPVRMARAWTVPTIRGRSTRLALSGWVPPVRTPRAHFLTSLSMIRVGATGRSGPIMIRVVGRAQREWWWVAVVGVAAVVGGVAVSRLRSAAGVGPCGGCDEGDWSGPDEYTRLTGISKESYEWRLLVATQSEMMGEWTVIPEDAHANTRQGVLERGSVDEVRLDNEGLDAALIVLFRSDDRPGCVFGWRIPIWPAPTPDPEDVDSTPEGWAWILAMNLTELRDASPGLPSCDPDDQGITWVGN